VKVTLPPGQMVVELALIDTAGVTAFTVTAEVAEPEHPPKK
jgi:hypothetical protein